MRKHKTRKAAVAVACAMVVSMALVVALSACSGSVQDKVAATVNGTKITEGQVTDRITQIREQMGIADDEAWGQYLVDSNTTVEALRKANVEALVDAELARQGAAELGVTASQEEVQAQIDNFKSGYETEEEWQKTLEESGMTEEGYRQAIEDSMLEQGVREILEQDMELSDEDYLEAAQMYISYFDGARHVSEIVWSVPEGSDSAALEKATAEAADVVARIRSGQLSFADAAKQYSVKDSAANGGECGWDIGGSLSSEMQSVAAGLQVGEVSDPTAGDEGVFVLTVTEQYSMPEDTSTITSLDQLPSDFKTVLETFASNSKGSEAYQEWLDGLREEADIVINDMPEGLPYDIDLTPYENKTVIDESATVTDEANDASTEEVSSEGATEDATASAAAESAAADGAAAEGAADESQAGAAQATSESQADGQKQAES